MSCVIIYNYIYTSTPHYINNSSYVTEILNILNAKECGIHAFQVTGDTIEEVFQKNHIL